MEVLCVGKSNLSQNKLGSQLLTAAKKIFDQLRGATISQDYIKLNAELHHAKETYGTSSSKWKVPVSELHLMIKATSVLDYGCGKALLKKSLPDLPNFQNYDPAVQQFSERPVPADLVICSDVLEHIEPHLLTAVLRDLANLTKKSSFLVISCRPAAKFLSDGRNAHLIQENEQWWMSQLNKYFSFCTVVDYNSLDKELVIIAGPSQLLALGEDSAAKLASLRQQVKDARLPRGTEHNTH